MTAALAQRRGFAQGLLSIADRTLSCLHIYADSPDADAILNSVRRMPGRRAIDRWAVEVPLRNWCAALREEAGLNAIGRIAAHWDAIRMLRTLCRLEDELEHDPAALEEPIEAPIIITGMPRSGTTFLHHLLGQDQSNSVPRCWQGMAPYPPRKGPDRRLLQAERSLHMLNRLAPELASVHPLTAETPQECSELMAPVFRSMRFDTTHRVPSYRRWLDRGGFADAYRFHRHFLQHLQRQAGPTRWVLKCPDHVFALDAVERTYPDARYVFLHRDPLKVLPSVARLTEILRAPFVHAVNRTEIGHQVTRDCHDSAERMVAAASGGLIAARRVVHLQYTTLVRDPIAAVEGIYRQFGLELGTPARGAMQAILAHHPRGGYGQNSYRSGDYRLDSQVERERFEAYTDYFGIEREVAP
jgi:hypothetical protein